MEKNKLRLLSILFSVIYWMTVAFYFVTIRYVGHDHFIDRTLNHLALMLYALGVGFTIGVLFGVFPLNDILRSGKRRSFLGVVGLRTCCYILFFMVMIFCASLYGNSVVFALSYVTSSSGLIVLFHLSVCSFLYHFILQINKKFGPGVLLEYTFGKYFAPKVEERVFMFLDLKSSTHMAEVLEHVSFSRMIQDCFAELTIPATEHRAQVYQYVGDEVIVSWNMQRDFSAAQCCDFFYAFRERMEARKEYFMSNYGLFPQFKAGMHCGKVTVAEVGEIKSEISYHGDVLNTTSRIQNLCNQYNRELLVSHAFVQLMLDNDRDKVSFVGEVELRGKEGKTRIYTIDKDE